MSAPSSPISRAVRHPYLLLTLTVLFWSGNMVVGRALREAIPPMSLALGRWILAFLLTLPFAWPHRNRLQTLDRREWGILAVLGVLGVGAYNTLAYIALSHTTATNAALLNSFIPVAILVLTWWLGHRSRPLEIIGVGVSLAGVMTILSHGELRVLTHLQLNIGDVWMLGAVLSWALYTVCLRWRPEGLHPMALLAVLTAIGLMVLAPLVAWELAGGAQIRPDAGLLAGIAYTGIFPAFLGYVFYNRAVAQVGAATGGLFIHLMPAFSTLLAMVFLGEQPHLHHFFGIALILAGIGLTTGFKNR
ncbi:MAG TPA: DMT family transporter [Zoogloea sp.]|uniref:DMT family transporter n=1 Tax=Zoogloea sp. TaxID=49181 RepID=UPI002CC3ACC3|nr:DMT family transporter [Zoogloea sp.]HMV17765.1 DMT family transporter [Rhodocyclaceae bacterium]HMV63496.1 DMT family transporter [Rhodocyclaceae bacterium]HMW52976.1 DMT family transporter [Rhodocyclaceae bacterium]HNA68425.1 DMT family transporter [Rhodocyclaceae bacterium]HNB65320.1 DMT family transporter [Rhodocyclaceae bacterium]